jgi:hypothetical protein
MRRFVAAITIVALLRATAWAQQEEPVPPPPPPPPQQQQQQPTYAYPPQQQPTYYPPAPQPYPPPPPYGRRPAYGQPVPGSPDAIYRSGRHQRTIGMILTFVGVGIGALGLALLYDAKYNPHNDEVDEAIEDIFGVMLTAAGIGCFIPGVILWANGSAKMDEAMQMGASGWSLTGTPRVSIAPGLTWTYRF